MVDKAEVKKYISKVLGEQFIIGTYGVWDQVKDIPWEKFPNQFVIKCTHDSGGVIICKDKAVFDYDLARNKLGNSLSFNYYLAGREWPYKNVCPRILAEEYLIPDSNGDIFDYKLMCFNGVVKCIFVCSRRGSAEGLRVTFYDPDWKIMPFSRSYPAEECPIPKPRSLNCMIASAEKLSKNIAFVRVDFYEVNGSPKFGEITFYPGNGLEAFDPEEWDYILGDWLKLPNIK